MLNPRTKIPDTVRRTVESGMSVSCTGGGVSVAGEGGRLRGWKRAVGVPGQGTGTEEGTEEGTEVGLTEIKIE